MLKKINKFFNKFIDSSQVVAQISYLTSSCSQTLSLIQETREDINHIKNRRGLRKKSSFAVPFVKYHKKVDLSSTKFYV